MSTSIEISDEEFVPFLHSLGVETYNKSFEWMLSDREFAGVLRWLYNNLDHNNALTAREEMRYKELEKNGLLLSPDDVEFSIHEIQQEYEGICLPGDLEAMEISKLNIQQMKERLVMIEKQEAAYKELKNQNELLNKELNLEIAKLNAAHQQCVEDEESAANQCMSLAQEVETLTEGVTDVIADTLDVYSSCHADKENAKKFFTFGPFESYRQSQALFRSHFDLYTSKKFAKVQDASSDEELRLALLDARNMERRLSEAAMAYIDSKVDLCGEQAKLALITNYKEVHPSQITTCLLEAQTAVELLEQEESILYQQLHTAVKQLVDERTALAVETAANCAQAAGQQVLSDLSTLLETSTVALRLDRALYTALRHELQTVEQFVQFADELRQYVISESDAVKSRIDSMNDIYSERTACEAKLNSSDMLMQVLHLILSGQSGIDAQLLVKQYWDLINNAIGLKQSVSDEYYRKERALVDFKTATKPLRNFIWDGCTRQPNSRDRSVATLAHALIQLLHSADKQVLAATDRFTTVKTGDKHQLRKLWQWFLADPTKLTSMLKMRTTGLIVR